jgi:hypothetical protein
VLALLRAKSPILGSLAASVFSDAARFRVKRVRGEMGACCSGRACFREPRRLEWVEMLTGDRGMSRLRWPISIDAAIIENDIAEEKRERMVGIQDLGGGETQQRLAKKL